MDIPIDELYKLYNQLKIDFNREDYNYVEKTSTLHLCISLAQYIAVMDEENGALFNREEMKWYVSWVKYYP